LKLRYDAFKHLTTLNTGAILIIVALLEKFIAGPRWRVLVSVAFLLFLISTIFSFMMMNAAASYIRDIPNTEDPQTLSDKRETKALDYFVGTCIGSFILGLLSMAIFAIRNL